MDSINAILKCWRPFPKMLLPNQHRPFARSCNEPMSNWKCDCGKLRNYLNSFIISNPHKRASIHWYLDNFFDDVQCCFGCNKGKKLSDEQAYEICCRPKRRRKAKKNHLETVTPTFPVYPTKPWTGIGLKRERYNSVLSQEVNSKKSKCIYQEELARKLLPQIAIRKSSVPKSPESRKWFLDEKQQQKDENEAKKLRLEDENNQKLAHKLKGLERFMRLKERNQKRSFLPTNKLSDHNKTYNFVKSIYDKGNSDSKDNTEGLSGIRESVKLSDDMLEKSLLKIVTQKRIKERLSDINILGEKVITPFGNYGYWEKPKKHNVTKRFRKMLHNRAYIVPELHPMLESRISIHEEQTKKTNNKQNNHEFSISKSVSSLQKQEIKKEKPWSKSFNVMLKDFKEPEDHPNLESRILLSVKEQRKTKNASKLNMQFKGKTNEKKNHKISSVIPAEMHQVFTDSFDKKSMHDMPLIENRLKTENLIDLPLIKNPLKTENLIDLPSKRRRNSQIISGLPSYQRILKNKPLDVEPTEQFIDEKTRNLKEHKTDSVKGLEWEPPIPVQRNKPGLPKSSKPVKKRKLKLSFGKSLNAASIGSQYYINKPSFLRNSNSSCKMADYFKEYLKRFNYNALDLSYVPKTLLKENVKPTSIKYSDNLRQEDDNDVPGIPLKALRKFSWYVKNSLPDRQILKKMGSKTYIHYLRSKKKNYIDIDSISLKSKESKNLPLESLDSTTLPISIDLTTKLQSSEVASKRNISEKDINWTEQTVVVPQISLNSIDTCENKSNKHHQNNKTHQPIQNTQKKNLFENPTITEIDYDSQSKPSSKSLITMEAVGKEIEKRDAMESTSEKYIKEKLRKKFTLQQREILNEQLPQYAEQFGMLNDYPVKKPPHNFETEAKRNNLRPSIEQNKPPLKSVKNRRRRKKFPTILETLRISDLNSETTEQLYKQFSKDLTHSSSLLFRSQTKSAGTEKKEKSLEKKDVSMGIKCEEEQPYGYRAPDSALIKQMKWGKLNLIAYYRFLKQGEYQKQAEHPCDFKPPCSKNDGLRYCIG